MNKQEVIELIQKMISLNQRQQAIATYKMVDKAYPEWNLKEAFEAMKND